MTDYLEVIKNQFFSTDNIDFIMQMVTKKNITIDSHQLVFNACNKIFNQFIHTVYSQKKSINPGVIEELLITLNKMTIDSIVDDVQNNSINHIPSPPRISYTPSVSDIHEVMKDDAQIVQEIKESQTITIQDNTVFKSTFKEHMYIYSEDCEYDNGMYKLDIQKDKLKTSKLLSIEILNDLYNITEHNNKLEVSSKNIKKNITIPIGCYDLDSLLNMIKDSIEDKLKNSINVSYNKYKNRIYINGESPFSFQFIENDEIFTPLSFMLGFDKKEYMNNNNYSTNKEPSLNIYDNIYVKVLNKEYTSIFNKKTCKNIPFFEKISFNQIDTFGKNVIINNLNNNINDIDIDNISIEFYYRHVNHRKFYRINNKLKFVLEFEFERYL